MAVNAPYYLDSPTFSSATSVWIDSALTIKAPDGYYLFGDNYRQQVSGILLSAYTCGSCLDCIPGSELTIGTQIWTGCNLDVDVYSNGDSIPQVEDPTAWAALTTGAWCHYNNNPVNGTTYGKLYNWYAVNDPRGLAPTGYHIPTDTEWTTLIDYLGGDAVAGGKMKETGLCHWFTPNAGATNSSGFTGFGGGSRLDDGTFYFINKGGYFWSSTENDPDYAWYRILGYNAGDSGRSNADKISGFSVRLIKD
jgi:uncharacterized protein (TIGR02145 family)